MLPFQNTRRLESGSAELRRLDERRNVTLSLPRDLIKRAKVLAARRDVSMSDLFREALEEKVLGDLDFRRAELRQLERMATGWDLGTRGRAPHSRDEIHARG